MKVTSQGPNPSNRIIPFRTWDLIGWGLVSASGVGTVASGFGTDGAVVGTGASGVAIVAAGIEGSGAGVPGPHRLNMDYVQRVGRGNRKPLSVAKAMELIKDMDIGMDKDMDIYPKYTVDSHIGVIDPNTLMTQDEIVLATAGAMVKDMTARGSDAAAIRESDADSPRFSYAKLPKKRSHGMPQAVDKRSGHTVFYNESRVPVYVDCACGEKYALQVRCDCPSCGAQAVDLVYNRPAKPTLAMVAAAAKGRLSYGLSYTARTTGFGSEVCVRTYVDGNLDTSYYASGTTDALQYLTAIQAFPLVVVPEHVQSIVDFRDNKVFWHLVLSPFHKRHIREQAELLWEMCIKAPGYLRQSAFAQQCLVDFFAELLADVTKLIQEAK